MSNLPRSWFRQSKNTWYATIKGEKVRLQVQGQDRDAEAWFSLFTLLQEQDPTKNPEQLTVLQLVDAYLRSVKETVSEGTYKYYRWCINRWTKSVKGNAMDITPMDVVRFATKQNWGLATRLLFVSNRSPLLNLAQLFNGSSAMLRYHATAMSRMPGA